MAQTCSGQILQSESLRPLPTGEVAFIKKEDRKTVWLGNLLTGDSLKLSFKNEQLGAYAISNMDHPLAVVAFDDRSVSLYEASGAIIEKNNLESHGTVGLLGSLSRLNDVFFVGLVQFNKVGEYSINYIIFKIHGNAMKQIALFQDKNIGTIVRFKESYWLLYGNESRKIQVSSE